MGPDDVLEISVFGHPDMTTTVRVDGQGKIIFPLIGQVNAAGLTTDQLSRQIASRLADGYLINPQVNVFVKEFREQKAVILGQVTHPGLYKLRPQTTLLEMISQAGGLTKEAGSKAILKRTIKGEDEKNKVVQQSIDLDRLINEGDTSLNISIQDGDNIFVTKAGVFYVTGEVKKPDSYKLEENLTLIKAIALAGGFTDTAAKDGVRIVRKHGGKEEIIKDAPMNEKIQADDVIVVPESFF